MSHSNVPIQRDEDWRKLRYAQSTFSLEPEDLARHPEELNILLGCEDSYEAFDQAVRDNPVLCAIMMRNAYRKIGEDVRSVEKTEAFGELVELLRSKIGSTLGSTSGTVETFLKGLYPSEVEALHPDRIDESRDEAVWNIESEYSSLIENWREPSYALDDVAMSKIFKSRGRSSNKYLTTYLDSARVGLVNKPLQEAIDEDAYEEKERWEPFKKRMQQLIVASLDSNAGDIIRQRFFADNCFFQFNGTEAFMLYRRNFMKKGEMVVATSEEYSENIQDMKEAGILVDQLSDHSDVSDFLAELEVKLKALAPQYILVSVVSRFGNIYPLQAINEIRKRISPDTKLIVDACQSAGRRNHAMHTCEADAVILSVTKGADLGQGLGVLAVAGAAPRREAKDLNGSAPPENLARTAYSLNPAAMDLDKMNIAIDLRKLILTPEQRAEAVRALTEKFLELAAAVGVKHGNRLHILNPKNTDEPAHAVEFRIRGVSRRDLCAYLAQYGIYADHEYVDPADDESLRIAFHPYMNDRAIKILCGALESCLKQESL